VVYIIAVERNVQITVLKINILYIVWKKHITRQIIILYISVSQLPGRGPVPGPGINYTGPREILLELITN